MEREIKVISSIDKKDFRHLIYWNMFGRNLLVGIMLGAIFLIGLIVLFLFSGTLNGKIIAGIFLAAPLIVIGYMEFTIMKMRSAEITARTKGEFTFNGKGIKAMHMGADSYVFYDWDHVETAYETSRFYIIFVNRIQMLTIKKSDIQEEDREDLVKLIKDHTKRDYIGW